MLQDVLLTSAIFLNCHSLLFTIHKLFHHGLTTSSLLLCPAQHILLCFDRPPTQPRNFDWPHFNLFVLVMQLFSLVWFGFVLCVLVTFSHSREIKTIVIFYIYIQKSEERGVLPEGRDNMVLCISPSMFSEPLKEQHACYLKGYDIQREKKKYRQGTVAALVFTPKAGNNLANLKIKYASPEQLSLLDSQSGGRNSIAYIMWTRRRLFFFQRLKKSLSLIFTSTK